MEVNTFMVLVEINDNLEETITKLLSAFGAMTNEEIHQFFPTFQASSIDSAIKTCISNGSIRTDNIYYQCLSDFQKKSGTKKRTQYKKSLDFVRYLITSVDSDNYLINNITYIGVAKPPCCLFIMCNNNIYDIYYLQDNSIKPITSLINRNDKDLSNDELLTNDRIVVTDNTESFKLVNIKKVKFFVSQCKDGSWNFGGVE